MRADSGKIEINDTIAERLLLNIIMKSINTLTAWNLLQLIGLQRVEIRGLSVDPVSGRIWMILKSHSQLLEFNAIDGTIHKYPLASTSNMFDLCGDGTQRLYLSIPSEACLHIFDSSSTAGGIANIVSTDNKGKSGPCRMAGIGSGGVIAHIANHDGSQIGRYDSDGEELWRLSLPINHRSYDGMDDVIPVINNGECFAVTSTRKIVIYRLDMNGIIIDQNELFDFLDNTPTLRTQANGRIVTDWPIIVTDATAGPEPETILLTLNIFNSGTKFLYYRWGATPRVFQFAKQTTVLTRPSGVPGVLAFDMQQLPTRISMFGSDRLVGYKSIPGGNYSNAFVYEAPNWEQGEPFESV